MIRYFKVLTILYSIIFKIAKDPVIYVELLQGRVKAEKNYINK